ncbi:FecR family protein [Chitinophaga niabensis]|uniref:Ferric-dicitrate binding protein FerR, regulates iron transport through sigma-19 n=1 Tax=Chitinophaga niabensis TaxID=536979 RepID=A0A1N6FHX7_9BACT|nr:FecR domain-containing protein [Chitinophaga niabensis]SIN94898.1 ferric-dicitrate binding protein FerR, regulates iron transport through sigma-19 [Chitinophaga niabensis]
MSIQRFWILTGRKLSGEATAEELEEWTRLSAIYPVDPSTAQFLQLMARHWGKGEQEAPDDETAQRLTTLLAAKMNKPIPPVIVTPGKRPYKKWISIAACLLLVIFTGAGYLFYGKKEKEVSFQEITAARGNKSHVVLPDGSHVWLNADSRLSYSEDFGRENRTVRLEGEAYFDVTKMAEIPFLIELGDHMKIRVLGTAFNLKAYKQDSRVETSLISGSLEVEYSLGETMQKVLLKPMQKLSLQKTEQPGSNKDALVTTAVQMTPIEYYNEEEKVIREVVWKENKLCFDATPFDQVLQQLERWFNIRVVLKDESLKQKIFTAYIKAEDLLEVMDALSRSAGYFDYEYDKENRIVTISKKK